MQETLPEKKKKKEEEATRSHPGEGNSSTFWINSGTQINPSFII